MPTDKVDWNVFTYILGGLTTFLSVVLGVIWKRNTSTKELLIKHMESVSNEYPKTHTVEKMLEPINRNIEDIRKDVRMLVNNHIKENSNKS